MDPRAFRRPIEPLRGASPDDAFASECFDFAAYLGRRMGVERELATELLGEWLRAYEPADDSSAAGTGKPPSEVPRSGPRASSAHADLGLTGTDR